MKYFIALLFIIFVLTNDNNRAYQANRAFEERDYARAEELYRQILNNDPQNAEVLFNLGNTLAAQGELEASMQVFEQFKEQASLPEKQALADYNIGFIHERMGNEREALNSFRQALTHNPDDEDAKFNYELLRRRLQEPPEDDEEDPDEEDQEEESHQDAEGDAPPEEDAEGDDPADADQDSSSEPDQEQQQEPSEISREQLRHAEDIMNALEHIEKELIKDFQKRQMDPVRPHEKDW
ncbi:tetratricopeptide repeat protein [Balneolaceae bacterium ANBcel3]|nr:tetratricopeptide repeat protein [Balneolaceae bacterium ANBcel3]